MLYGIYSQVSNQGEQPLTWRFIWNPMITFAIKDNLHDRKWMVNEMPEHLWWTFFVKRDDRRYSQMAIQNYFSDLLLLQRVFNEAANWLIEKPPIVSILSWQCICFPKTSTNCVFYNWGAWSNLSKSFESVCKAWRKLLF